MLVKKDLEDIKKDLSEAISHFSKDFDHQSVTNLYHELPIIKSILQKKKDEGKELTTLIELFRETQGVFHETNKLVQIILTYPVTSNEGERSFSMLRRLYTGLRTSMNTDRLDNLGRMHGHPLRLAEISNDRVMDIFVGRGPRRLQLVVPNSSRFKPNGGNNIPYFFFYSFIIIINFLLGLRFLTLYKTYYKIIWTNIVIFFFHFILTKKKILYSYLYWDLGKWIHNESG